MFAAGNIETEIFSHDDDDDDNEEDGRNCVSFVLDQKLWEQLLLPSSDVIWVILNVGGGVSG